MSTVNLSTKLMQVADMSRLNTVESALSGTAGAQQNFSAQWQGYDALGQGQVKVNGILYSGAAIAPSSIPVNSSVMLRVGPGMKVINW